MADKIFQVQLTKGAKPIYFRIPPNLEHEFWEEFGGNDQDTDFICGEAPQDIAKGRSVLIGLLAFPWADRGKILGHIEDN